MQPRPTRRGFLFVEGALMAARRPPETLPLPAAFQSEPSALERVAIAFAQPGRAKTYHELALLEAGFHPFAGIDEAGRGPLAGPVVAGAVVLPETPNLWKRLQRAGVGDSKAIAAEKRAKLFDLVTHTCRVGVGQASPTEIDRHNILEATRLAMRRAVAALGAPAPRFLLIDGDKEIAALIPQRPLVQGDARSLVIGAASIIAKVTRDRIMEEACARFPQYGWEHNKGYPTADHLAALGRHGPCEMHRASFGPVARLNGSLQEQATLFGDRIGKTGV